jgi:DNA-binding PadR family transcriptional regulator
MADFRHYPPEPTLLVLLSLAGGAKHGYAVMLDIRSFAGIRSGPGSLYGALRRLQRRGFIEAARTDARRQPFRLTDLGRLALLSYLVVLDDLLGLGRGRLAPP